MIKLESHNETMLMEAFIPGFFLSAQENLSPLNQLIETKERPPASTGYFLSDYNVYNV